MGKWYNHKTYLQYKDDMKAKRNHPLDEYLPHVVTIANTFPRESVAIGALDINDLIQAGNKGLVEAWANIDEERPQAEKWSFLKKRIKGAIRREIDNNGTTIKIPRRELEKNRANLTAHEKILVNIFPKFFDNEVINRVNIVPYISLQLEELIDDALVKHVVNADHHAIVKKFYGIGYDKTTTKKLAEEYNKNTNAIGQIIYNVKKSLNNDEFEKIIENFYKNL